MIKDLVEKFEEYNLCLEEERLEDIDFDELQSLLRKANDEIFDLEKKTEMGDKLLLDFKGEMMKMSLAIAKANPKGENISSSLTERLILSDLSFEEMIGLRKQLRDEFNKSFPTSPQYQIRENSKEEMETSSFKS
ncbi:MAG: hypothetical protein MUO85_08780 [candidate division Zixibacteria bacterium]|nr:hypothetical protein [candidate division Zixibacteria bacterium]